MKWSFYFDGFWLYTLCQEHGVPVQGMPGFVSLSVMTAMTAMTAMAAMTAMTAKI